MNEIAGAVNGINYAVNYPFWALVASFAGVGFQAVTAFLVWSGIRQMADASERRSEELAAQNEALEEVRKEAAASRKAMEASLKSMGAMIEELRVSREASSKAMEAMIEELRASREASLEEARVSRGALIKLLESLD